jgi:hypothetical protein
MINGRKVNTSELQGNGLITATMIRMFAAGFRGMEYGK